MSIRDFHKSMTISAVRVSLALIGVLAGGALLTGCHLGDAQFSDKEIAALKKGPPKEMPIQAKLLFEQASKAGTGPPRQTSSH